MIESDRTVTFEDRRFDYDEQRFITLGMLREDVVVISTARRMRKSGWFRCGRQSEMSRKSTTAIFDEDVPITQADIDAGKLVLRKREGG